MRHAGAKALLLGAAAPLSTVSQEACEEMLRTSASEPDDQICQRAMPRWWNFEPGKKCPKVSNTILRELIWQEIRSEKTP